MKYILIIFTVFLFYGCGLFNLKKDGSLVESRVVSKVDLRHSGITFGVENSTSSSAWTNNNLVEISSLVVVMQGFTGLAISTPTINIILNVKALERFNTPIIKLDMSMTVMIISIIVILFIIHILAIYKIFNKNIAKI